jgi:pyrroloquinoline quinone (PQQ) biosynthesis protein C
VEELFQQQVDEFAACEDFQNFEQGCLSNDELRNLIANILRAHLRSPKLVAFLYALSPPGAATDSLRHNLLEELGVEDEVAHPDLLKRLGAAVGLGPQLESLCQQSDEDLKRYVVEPLLFGTLKEVGLGALAEIVAFEYMLSRLASRIARSLAKPRKLDADALEWFTHHSEVDVRHAEQGLDNLIQYVRWYAFSDHDALTLLKLSFRENVFIKRYFGEFAQARARGSL